MHIYNYEHELHARFYRCAAAKNMGFALSPPAYLSLAPASSSGPLVPTAVSNGVNYASGGAGILDSTVSIASIHLQIE
jgi:hypothetical protein